MPNVYISLGVHGFFRDAPTTLLNLLEYKAYVPRSITTIQSFVCFYINQGWILYWHESSRYSKSSY